VRAHQDLRSGDLIGAFPPLCVVYGPQGSAPDNEALADAILDQQLTPEQLRWLQLLHAGHGCNGGPREAPRLHALRQLLLQQPHDHPTHHHHVQAEGEELSTPGLGTQLLSQEPHAEAARGPVQGPPGHTPPAATARGQGLLITLAPPPANPAQGQELPITLAPPHANPAPFPTQGGQHAEGLVGEQSTGLPGVKGSYSAGKVHGSEAGIGQGAGSAVHGAQGGGVPRPDAIQGMLVHAAEVASAGSQGHPQQGGANPHCPADSSGQPGTGAGGPQGIGIQGTNQGGLSIQEMVGKWEGDRSSCSVNGLGAGLQQARSASRAWVLEALSCHTLGDSCEDVAVAQLRQQEPLQSYCGLWPEFALLNHSCSPNTVYLVVGGWLLLRAARPIAEGTELTTCHIGAGRFQHVASRRSQLQREFGFHCTCGRCTLEHHFFPTRRYPQSLVFTALVAAVR